MRKLPSLNTLKAFEAVARLGGVQKASDELCVTHGAVSRHLSQLEAWLGIPLFDRSERALRLTNTGRQYQHTLTMALDLMEEATQQIIRSANPNTLGIATTHSFASKWLLDRLPGFKAAHPEMDVWLTLEQTFTDFKTAGVDVAIRMGHGPWPGVDCLPLMEDRLVTVCRPGFLSEPDGLVSLKTLLSYPLLHDQDPNSQWSLLIPDIQGDANTLPGSRYASTDMLLKMASQGQGIALVSEVLAWTDIAAGHLVQATQETVPLGTYHWLVAPKGCLEQPRIRMFYQWLQAEVSHSRNQDINRPSQY